MTKRPPFENKQIGRAYVLRLSPLEPVTEDIERPWEPDEGLWLFEGAMDGRVRAPYKEVWDYCDAYSELPAMVMVLWAIWHPATPFGIGYEVVTGPDRTMVVMWRGRFYTQDRRGVLSKPGEPIPGHPTERDWWSSLAQFQAWKRRKALSDAAD